MKHLFFLLLISSVLSCNNSTEIKVILQDRMISFVPKEKGTRYFAYDTVAGERNILEAWADRTLFDLKEPVLFNYTGDGEFVRFVWLRSFENPVVIRINKFGDAVYAVVKELKIKNIDSASSVILKDKVITLDKAVWKDTAEPLENNNFWNFHYADNDLNEDGAIWFLEYKDNRRYKIIRRSDSGRLLSEPFKTYLAPLINLASEYVRLHSLR